MCIMGRIFSTQRSLFRLEAHASWLEYLHRDEAVPHYSTRVSELDYYRPPEAVFLSYLACSEFEYYHPEESVLHHSSPASHSEFYRPKLLVGYRRSRVCEIEV